MGAQTFSWWWGFSYLIQNQLFKIGGCFGYWNLLTKYTECAIHSFLVSKRPPCQPQKMVRGGALLLCSGEVLYTFGKWSVSNESVPFENWVGFSMNRITYSKRSEHPFSKLYTDTTENLHFVNRFFLSNWFSKVKQDTFYSGGKLKGIHVTQRISYNQEERVKPNQYLFVDFLFTLLMID